MEQKYNCQICKDRGVILRSNGKIKVMPLTNAEIWGMEVKIVVPESEKLIKCTCQK